MLLKGIISKLIPGRPVENAVCVGQTIFIQIGASAQSQMTIIEDVGEHFISVAGITSQEMSFVPLPGQQMRFFFLKGNHYFQAETAYVKQLTYPVYQWVLHKPSRVTAYKERRYAFRLEKVLDVDIKNCQHDPRDAYEFLTKNISTGGVLLITKASFVLHAHVTIRLPGISEREFLGSIVWKNEERYLGKWQYGVQFLNMTETQREAIARYVTHTPSQVF